MDGHRGVPRRPSVRVRLEARHAFQEGFFQRCQGYTEARPVVRRLFAYLLFLRLQRRRKRGDRGPSSPSYRAETARGLYLKCFLDLLADLPEGTAFGADIFTTAFLGRMERWAQDEVV